ncbi:unnamed protein product [Rotaria socialis]|uniref:Uncharacterized protein n=1 Tax=Rotaria socialis TaxID=392032 RepID=A0A821BBT5_9BILA|nr:unnamed protein product [Rotaria socialis]CAF4588725.1 unnamed protein product [Rotaria socialis]
MNQSSNRRNKQNQIGKYSAIFTDENNHSFNSGTTLSLQSMVDDLPFEFNPKYRTIIASRIFIIGYPFPIPILVAPNALKFLSSEDIQKWIPILVAPNALKFLSSEDIQKWIPILVTPNALKSLSSGDIQKWIPILVAPNALKFLSSEDT